MFQSGLQNSNRKCSCSCEKSNKKQKNDSCQVSFDCDRIFGEISSPGFRCDHTRSASCDFCPIRQMCDDILKDIKRWNRQKKKKKMNDDVVECSFPTTDQRKDALPNDVQELYKCAGMSSDPKKVESDFPLCDDFVRILRCLAGTPPTKKSPKANVCSYVCDYHVQDLERGSSFELCNPNAKKNVKGDDNEDKNKNDSDDSKRDKKEGSKDEDDKTDDKDKDKNKSLEKSDTDKDKSSRDKDKKDKGKRDKGKSDKDKGDKDRGKKDKGDKDKNKSKEKNRDKKGKGDDDDDDERLKGGREVGSDDDDADDRRKTKKPPKPTPQRFESADRQKAGAQKSTMEKQNDNTIAQKKIGKAKQCEYKTGKRGKECNIELNKAVGRKKIDDNRLRLEQMDLKRMNQNRCVPVPVCDPCLVCPPCEPVLQCDPCCY